MSSLKAPPVHRKSSTSNPKSFLRAARNAVQHRPAHRCSATARHGRRQCESWIPTPASSARQERSVRSGSTARTSPPATGGIRMLASAAPGTPDGSWLRSGDLGFVSEGEIFIVGRMKDLLIVYGRNHYAEDIESTVQEITGGRVAAISVPVDQTEKLVTIIEVKKRGDSDEDATRKLSVVKNHVTAAISKSHGLNVADLVLVPPGSIPTTTSGKIRRAACVEHYRQRQFTRLDA